MSIDTLLLRLDKVKARGKGQWTACCPAHSDSDPSLSITHADNGNILIYCHAGCAPADIVDSVGLDMGALFAEDFVKRHQKLIQYQQLQRRIKREKEKAAINPLPQETKDAWILDAASRKRANGEKLSDREMDLELAAYQRSRSS
ncbi:MAG: hypothetical protein GWN00_19855 [Aliifodinibius sp.]|nr:hypothetical protein [Fodinibius sp.]NIY26976.1 hypothetical protein [Fodinibius sp.]